MSRIYLGLGSNIGERLENLSKAIEALARYAVKVVAVSSVYETAPWGFVSDQKFLNMAVSAETELEPGELLRIIHEIESGLGRRRSAIQYESRLIDIDILFYDDRVIDLQDLTIPHPQIQNRRFVLVPLNEIAPRLMHPILGKTVSELLEVCADTSPAMLYRAGLNEG